MEITDKEFWEKYWANIKLPVYVDMNFKNDRIIAQTIKNNIKRETYNKVAVEIGCAPGKWLSFLNRELGYKVIGYEYIEVAASKTVDNLKMNNILEEHFEIKTVDFLKESIDEKFDIVLSLGFVEHFEDVNKILEKHLKILNEKGNMIVGLPNFRGINYIFQKISDRYLDKKMIENHNLSVMNLEIYEKFAVENELKIKFLDYVGGFEPALIDFSGIKNTVLKKIFGKLLNICGKIFISSNNKFISSYIIMIFEKS